MIRQARATSWRAILLGIVLIGGFPLAAGAEGFVVVVHADNPTPSLDPRTVGRMFLKKWNRWENGAKVVPVNLPAGSPVREAFTREVHGKDVPAIEEYWQRMIVSGRDVPPATVATPEEVFELIRESPGGIGYVAAGTVLPDWVRALPIRDDSPSELPSPTTSASGSGWIFKVVVHTDSAFVSLPRSVVQAIFMKKYAESASPEIFPVDLIDSPVREAFSRTILGRSTQEIKNFWRRRLFSGKEVPPLELTVEDALEFVRTTPGGIAYVPAGVSLPDGVRVLEITED